MRISIISVNNNIELISTVNDISNSFQDYSINIFAVGYCSESGGIKASEKIIYSADIYSCIKDADIIINLITYEKGNISKYKDISVKYNINMDYAGAAVDLVRCYPILKYIDILAQAIRRMEIPAIIINAGEPLDIITLYFYKTYNISSFGISRKADAIIETLFNAVGLNAYAGKVNYKLAGINNNLWIYEITDKKGKDLYPIFREKVKDYGLKLTRNDLTRDGLKSLKFYGYYHSANVSSILVKDIINKILSAINSGEKSTIYFNAINNNTISGMDSEACVEIPFELSGNKLIRESVTLPLQCILAINDGMSACQLIVKALFTKTEDYFKRTIKLDPYLSSILNLQELENLSDDILNIEKDLKSLLVKEKS